ncbi:MAG TPA: hypothetical protein VMP01_00450 [Pirellulaceae bacterium]|nr:hypothetical protein [Pirellulaceae bacterium]
MSDPANQEQLCHNLIELLLAAVRFHSNRSFAIQRECRIVQFRSGVSDAHMNSATPAIENLARRLIALEAMCDAGFIAGRSEAVRVCEKLRVPLAKFLGSDGYRSLMARALAIAKAETPSLVSVNRCAPSLRASVTGIASSKNSQRWPPFPRRDRSSAAGRSSRQYVSMTARASSRQFCLSRSIARKKHVVALKDQPARHEQVAFGFPRRLDDFLNRADLAPMMVAR